MAISFVNKSQSTVAASSAISIARPTDSTAGDLLIANIFVEDNTDRITTTRVPTGWSTAVNQTIGARAIRQYVHYKVLTTSEPTSYTWNLDAADEVVGIISAYRGVDSASPIGNIAVSTVNAQSSNVVAPQITVENSGNWAVICAGNAMGSTVAGGWVAPTSFTERAEVQTSTGAANVSAVIADYSPSSTGATGNKTYRSPGADYYIASFLELKLAPYSPDVTFKDEDVTYKDGDVLFDSRTTFELTVSNTYSACVADSVILEISDVELTVSDAYSACVSDEVSITDAFFVNAALNLQYADAVILVQEYNPVVSDTSHANIAGEITLSIPAVADVDTSWLDGESYKFQDDVAAEFYPHDVATLVLANGTQINVADTIDFFAQTVLIVSSAYDKQVTDSVLLSEEITGISFTPNASICANVSDTVTLSQEYTLTVENTYSVVAVESVTLLTDILLTISDCIQKNVTEDVLLLAEGIDNVIPVASTQYQYADAVLLVQEHELVVLDSNLENEPDDVGVSESGSLIVQNTYSVQEAGSVLISQRHEIVISNAANIQTAGAVVLLQHYTVPAAASYIVQVAGTPTPVVESENTVSVNSAVQVQVSDSLVLVLRYIITVDDSIQVNNSEALTYLATYQELGIANCINHNFAQNVVFGFTDGFLGVIVDPYLISITHQRAMESITQHRYLMQ